MARLDNIDNHKSSVKSTATNNKATSTGNSHHSSRSAHLSTGTQSKLKGRDTVYIDVDDDVTSIISRIKQSSEPVVALVPPAARGALNSVVNLKLIGRATEASKKHLALVTTDASLLNLAAGLRIPVAKNINAQAVVPDIDSSMDDLKSDDVIDGKSLSIGDLDDTSDGSKRDNDGMSAAVASIENDDRMKNDLDADGVNDDYQKKTNTHRQKKGNKNIPNFNDFRKKLLIGGAVVILLVGFIIWAVVFAPSTSIVIKAKTTNKDVSAILRLVPDAELNVNDGEVAPIVKISKSTETVNFDATGEREQGEKAKGSVYICNKQTRNVSLTSTATNTVDIPAGTLLYAGGVQFTTDASINGLEGWSDTNGVEDKQVCASVKATAVKYGSEYNVSDGTKMSVQGFSNSRVSASAKGDFAGGTRETVKYVQQSDVDSAMQKLKDQLDVDEAKKKLEKQLGDNAVVVGDSFGQNLGRPKSTPAVGEIASGQASVSVEVGYSLLGISRNDLNKILDSKLNSDGENQKIYDNGLKSVKFSNFSAVKHGYRVTAKTTGHIGPQIDEDKVKSNAVGKKSEEIKAELSKDSGVSNVTVKMSPFWVSTAPKADKIKVDFTVER